MFQENHPHPPPLPSHYLLVFVLAVSIVMLMTLHPQSESSSNCGKTEETTFFPGLEKIFTTGWSKKCCLPPRVGPTGRNSVPGCHSPLKTWVRQWISGARRQPFSPLRFSVDFKSRMWKFDYLWGVLYAKSYRYRLSLDMYSHNLMYVKVIIISS